MLHIGFLCFNSTKTGDSFTSLPYIANAKKLYMKQQSHSFESVRTAHASSYQLPEQIDVSHSVRRCNIVFLFERGYTYM